MRESDLERKVVEYCRKVGVLTYKFSSPSHRGVPDRIMLYKGRILFLELKATGEKIEKLQEWELGNLTDAGFTARWVDDLDSAKMLIDRLVKPE